MELHVRHAEPDRRIADASVVGDVDEVAARRELAPTGHAPAVDLGDHGLRQIPDAHPRVGDVSRPVSLAARGEVGLGEAAVSVAQLVAGGEARARTPHDRDADLRVVVGLRQRVQEFTSHRMVECVPLVRTVQGQASDPVPGIVDQQDALRRCAVVGIGHGSESVSPTSPRSPATQGVRTAIWPQRAPDSTAPSTFGPPKPSPANTSGDAAAAARKGSW